MAHGDGSQTRDYVYIEDAVNAMLAASIAPGVNQLVINVGSGTETSIRDLARLVVDITGGRPEVIFNPKTDAGVSRMCADLTLAHQKLDYQPLIPLEMGLRLTLEREPRLKQR